MRINPFFDAWLFLSGNTDEHRASGVGWLLVALFLTLVAASIRIAVENWRRDPMQRTAASRYMVCARHAALVSG
jgi:hypothetical protein